MVLGYNIFTVEQNGPQLLRTKIMTKKQAIQLAKKLRSEGKVVKVYERSGVYTQPGRGIVPFVEYFIVEQ